MKGSDRSPLPEELSGDDFESWLAEAERDPARSAEIDFLADLTAAAELERAPAARTPVPPRKVARTPARRWMLPTAALVLVAGALALWFAMRPETPRRASELAQRAAPRYVAVELRDSGASQDDGFASAMAAYARGEWAVAADGLTAVLTMHDDLEPARFYLAAAREQMGDLAAAAALWSTVAERAPGLLGEHARWRLAQIHLAREEVADARRELEHLVQQQGDFAGRARELLAALERL